MRKGKQGSNHHSARVRSRPAECIKRSRRRDNPGAGEQADVSLGAEQKSAEPTRRNPCVGTHQSKWGPPSSSTLNAQPGRRQCRRGKPSCAVQRLQTTALQGRCSSRAKASKGSTTATQREQAVRIGDGAEVGGGYRRSVGAHGRHRAAAQQGGQREGRLQGCRLPAQPASDAREAACRRRRSGARCHHRRRSGETDGRRAQRRACVGPDQPPCAGLQRHAQHIERASAAAEHGHADGEGADAAVGVERAHRCRTCAQ